MKQQDGLIVVDTPAGIEFASWPALRGALNIEMSTGLKYSRGRSALAIARDRLELLGRPGQKKVSKALDKKIAELKKAANVQ